ncbi:MULTISPECIES: O-acetyl-ADP-ribose deacetylase [Asticcacaulis]|uniref:O-acetyl-ADP-ribose deacetylase n=1 Tax=Asticcacaulis TaxID=76890 RepID=UPI001AE72EF5|nr:MULTISPECIES: O-acetyl-ADP-ribose deacetylase [Asticcacaulis]MBP2160704.1 O-acetyl-ADP-ribose deacetylase (regulator of RNase III) [Asticcacaulis solisilvae]MDR6801749.1 O-acetyl-ADP-ribose deacetylase (regulator of RNase III) [Asticcacaulis sp. BE141]
MAMGVYTGDITELDVDAIVNAANSSLLGGGGVDGAIHRAAGPELLAACRKLNGCKTGQAKMTPGFRLKARHVIHTVGPVWHGGGQGEDGLLADCYRNALNIAIAEGLGTIAFPAISTGVYRFPPERAARIAVTTVRDLLTERGDRDVIFCCFSADSARLHEAAIAAAG